MTRSLVLELWGRSCWARALKHSMFFSAIFPGAAVSRSPPSGLMRLLFGSIACYSQRSVWASCPGSWQTGWPWRAPFPRRPAGLVLGVTCVSLWWSGFTTIAGLEMQLLSSVSCISTAHRLSDQLHRDKNSRINDGNSVSVVKQLSNTIESLFGSIRWSISCRSSTIGSSVLILLESVSI